MDLITGIELTTKESFIESLTHDSYVIQIPNLTRKRRNELETLLGIFDQTLSVDPAHHILNVREEDFPERYRPLIRRLQMAVSEPETRKQMTLEDGILQDFENMQREIEGYKQKTAEAKQAIEDEKQKTAEAEKEIEELRKRLAEFEKGR
jgi:chromosome segregation ATPase